MSERLHRLAAIVRADFLVRFRRPSTVVVFLLLSACAYLWIPDPSTGRALLQVAGRRAIYNSAAIGMATAMLGTIFVGLFGFYVVSNALRRDILSRCGFVIASTTVRSGEYIAGKFAGNVLFLTVFMGGFMATSMTMQIVRGEARFEPLVFAWQYLLLVPPTIMFVSAIAITFESMPVLRGKFGDVLYFFVWVASLGVVASTAETSRHVPALLRYFDVSGFAFTMENIRGSMDTAHMSIGSSSFDATKPTIVFRGLTLPVEWILPRIGATLMPLLLLLPARFFFHRFDPARVKAVTQKSDRTWTGRVNAMAKPFARAFVRVLSAFSSIRTPLPLFDAARADALATIAGLPLLVLAMLGFAIATLASDAKGLSVGVMPIAFAALAIAIADIASREKRSGTTAFVFAAPHLRNGFVLWKFTSALLLALVFLAVPILRAVLTRPSSALPLLIGIAFICAAATALGVISANPKTFLVAFLTFWYVVMSDKGVSPKLDFAGFFGTATTPVMAAYAALTAGFLTVAHLFHLAELRRRW